MTDTERTRHITCIICPMGCQLEVTLPEGFAGAEDATADPASFSVAGNACPRGDRYARTELTRPMRTLTCTVAVRNGSRPLVSAKTKTDVPKEKLLDCMKLVRRLCVEAPVHAGDTLIRDMLGTGSDLVACEDVTA